MIGCRAECHGALERQVQGLAAVDGEGVELAREGSVRVSPTCRGARGETGGRDRELHPVGVRRTAESERDALERTLLIAQLAQARVDFRFPPGCAGVEVHVRVDALELDALVVEVPAVRRGDDHRIGKRAAHGPGGLELTAGAGRQQTQVLGGDREAQIHALVDVPIERHARASQADPHLTEAPGVSRACQGAGAARRHAAQLAAQVTERGGEIPAGVEAAPRYPEHEAEAAGQIRTQQAGIDAPRVAQHRPALRRGPHHLAADARVTAEQVDLRAVEREAVVAECAAHVRRHRRQPGDLRAAAQPHPVRQHAGEGEGAGGAGHRRVTAHQRPAEVAHLAAQIESRPVDADGAGAAGYRPGGEVAQLPVPGGQHALGVAAGELRLEQPGAQSGGVHRPVGTEARAVAAAGQVAGDAAERAAHAPGAQIEIPDHGIAHPVPLVGEIDRLAGEVGAERAVRVRHDVQDVEIAPGAAGHGPGGPSRRAPQEAPLDLQPQGIGGEQVADRADARLASQEPLGLKEADDVVTDDRGAADVGGLQTEAVGNGERRARHPPLLGADDEPARHEDQWTGERGMAAALHLNEGAPHRAVTHADGLQHEWHERYLALDAFELQVHQVVIDLDALDAQALGHRAADADDVELHARHAVRDVPDEELQPAVGVERRPDEGRRRHEGQGDGQAGEHEQQAARAEHRYSFGEKLMCSRGPGCTDWKRCPVASHCKLLDRGSAMSTPSVMTGRRTLRPMPTEYCSEVHSCC